MAGALWFWLEMTSDLMNMQPFSKYTAESCNVGQTVSKKQLVYFKMYINFAQHAIVSRKYNINTNKAEIVQCECPFIFDVLLWILGLFIKAVLNIMPCDTGNYFLNRYVRGFPPVTPYVGTSPTLCHLMREKRHPCCLQVANVSLFSLIF